MINLMEIYSPEQVGGGATMLKLRVTITLSGVVASDRYYYFNANSCSCVYNAVEPNMAVIHFGNQHTLTIDNSVCNTWIASGSSKASPIAVAETVMADIGAFV